MPTQQVYGRCSRSAGGRGKLALQWQVGAHEYDDAHVGEAKVTKLRWEKASQRQLDPGGVIAPPEELKPDRWVPPLEQARKKAKRAEENRLLLKRSEQKRYQAILKKYGSAKAFVLGVPKNIIDAHDRSLMRQAKRKLKRKQRQT